MGQSDPFTHVLLYGGELPPDLADTVFDIAA
jgi:hypothetical protein